MQPCLCRGHLAFRGMNIRRLRPVLPENDNEVGRELPWDVTQLLLSGEPCSPEDADRLLDAIDKIGTKARGYGFAPEVRAMLRTMLTGERKKSK